METAKYTPLPYVFDLMYDLKSVEELYAHLTGKQRFATSATDAALVQMMIENDVPLPEGYVPPAIADLTSDECHIRYVELLKVVEQLHMHAKRSDGDDRTTMDSAWVLEETGKALAKQPGLTDEQRKAYEEPSPFLNQ